MTHSIRKRLRLGRLFEAFSLDIVKPAMEGTSDSSVLHPPIGERRQTMRAVKTDEARAAMVIPKKRQLLSHHFHLFRLSSRLQLARQTHGLPITAKQFPARSPPVSAAQEFILLLRQHRTLLCSREL
jgi:hypothetical protein